MLRSLYIWQIFRIHDGMRIVFLETIWNNKKTRWTEICAKKSYSKNIDIRSSISGAFEQDEKEMIAIVLTLAVFSYLFFWHLVFTPTKHINLSK